MSNRSTGAALGGGRADPGILGCMIERLGVEQSK
jgi:hypothetical protein